MARINKLVTSRVLETACFTIGNSYAPLQDALFEQFERIQGPSGTLIVLFNMRRIETGDFELNFDTPYDVRLSQFEQQR